MNISISPRKTTIVLLATIVFLALAYLGTWYVYTEYQRYDKIYRLFDFDSEGNMPSLFSALLLLASSVLFRILASFDRQVNQRLYPYLNGLSVIFFFLFLDEGAGIHECLGNTVRGLLNVFGIKATGRLYVAWFIPYIAFLFIFLIVYSKFLLQINSRLRYLMIISGLIYVTGAAGLEILGGRNIEFLGISNEHYLLYEITLEEMLEMIGIVILNYSLMDHIATRFNKYDIKLLFIH